MLKNLRNKLNEKKNKKGFTLIELIIVIAIIAILAALLLPKLGAVKENSNKTSDIANGKKIAESILALSAEDKFTMGTDNEVKSGETVGDYLQTIPKGRTSVVKDKAFYYDTEVDGTVEVYIGGAKGTGKQIYPSPTADFQQK